MAVALVVVVILLAVASVAFTDYNERTSARRAAQVFAGDLTLARSMAVRGRESVTIQFNEGSKWYTVTTSTGRELARRRFGPSGEVNLTAVTLDLTGDSLRFSARGVGNLGAATLGNAVFTSGSVDYQVQFNSLGASKVGEP
jgi:Tfp pilus assembly protein FimT